MVFTTAEDATIKVPMKIWDMERAINQLPWYCFLKRWKMKEQLAEMRAQAAMAGFTVAIKELKDMGVLE